MKRSVYFASHSCGKTVVIWMMQPSLKVWQACSSCKALVECSRLVQVMEDRYTGVRLAERDDGDLDAVLPQYESWMPTQLGLQDPTTTLLVQGGDRRRLHRAQPRVSSQRGELQARSALSCLSHNVLHTDWSWQPGHAGRCHLSAAVHILCLPTFKRRASFCSQQAWS